EGGKLPAPFANGVFIAEHGPYGDNPQYGHRIVFVSMVPGRLQQGPHDLATGWAPGGVRWGRPVDVAVGADGALYVTDDMAGAVYRIAYTGP
ncbi:MAG TPA: hypothetical protein VFL91_08640, partial [Thermomicrobiales bacterium]|nr:hypothetical protein [Thermomicrobiales bacterium]